MIGFWLWNSNPSARDGRAFGTANQLPPGGLAAAKAGPSVAGSAAGGEADPALAAKGQQLATQFGCVACHTIDGVSSGTVGPNLTHQGSNPQVAGILPNNKENVVKWISNPPAVKPGTAMPNLGLTPDEADKIADYLQSLK